MDGIEPLVAIPVTALHFVVIPWCMGGLPCTGCHIAAGAAGRGRLSLRVVKRLATLALLYIRIHLMRQGKAFTRCSINREEE